MSGWRHYAKARPDEWEIAQEVLESATGHYEEHDATLSVVLSLGGSDQLPLTSLDDLSGHHIQVAMGQ